MRYRPGALAKDVAMVMCLALCPLCLCCLVLIPYHKKSCRWLKDVEHFDPSTGEKLGCYTHNYSHSVVRGKMQFTDTIKRRQPVTQTIVFRSKPVQLPDGVSQKLSLIMISLSAV